MVNSFLKTLLCPFCGSKLVVTDRFLEIEGRIINGVVSCECAKYPVLSGVLILSKDKIRLGALEFLTKEEEKLKSLKEIPFFLLSFPVGTKPALFLLSFFYRLNVFRSLSFSQLIHVLTIFRVINRTFASYLLNRFREKIFYPAAISATLVRKSSKVLDAGCGAGHLLHLLKGVTYEENLVGVDKSIINLYMAKKYFCRGANFIYLDLNYPLPFAESYFHDIFCNDVFHYVGNQKFLGKEFKRIVKKSGLIILNHLHNRTFSNYFDNPNEYSNTTFGYTQSFPGLTFSLFSEENADEGVLKHIREKDIKNQTKKLKTFTLFLYPKQSKRKFAHDNDIETNLNYIKVEEVI